MTAVVRCWMVHRKGKRPEGLDSYEVAASEVEKVHKGGDGAVSTLLLKDGGIAYSHFKPREIAEMFGWT